MNSKRDAVRRKERCFTCQSRISKASVTASKNGGGTGGSNSDNDDENNKLFLMRYLLGFPTSQVKAFERAEMIELCELCIGTVRKAKDLYQQLSVIVQQYRFIQMGIVEEMRILWNERHKKKGLDNVDGSKDSNVQDLANFVATHDYQFTGSFVICPEDFEKHQKESMKGQFNNSDDAKVEQDGKSIPDPTAINAVCEDISLKMNSEDEKDSLNNIDSDFNSDMSIADDFQDEMEDEDEKWSVPTYSTTEDDSRSDCSSKEEEEQKVKATPTANKATRKRKLEPTTYGGEEGKPVFLSSGKYPSSDYRYDKVKCNFCDERVGKIWGMKRHLRKVHGIVGETKKRKQLYRPKPIPVPTSVTCELCNESVSPPELSNHYREHVGDEYVRKCPNPSCWVVSPHSYALMQHHGLNFLHCKKFLSEKSNKKRICEMARGKRCEECGAQAGNPEVLFAHLRRKHEQALHQEHPCPMSECERKFSVRQSVEMHLLINHDLTYRQKQLNLQASQRCEECSEKMSVESMEDHLKEKHDAKEIIKCSHCRHLFSSRVHLIEHLYKKHRHGEIPFVCDICHQIEKADDDDRGVTTFSDLFKLREHYFEMHQIGQKYRCELCEDKEVCWTLPLFQFHMQYKHGGQPLVCDICEEISQGSSITFKAETTLTSHKIRMHGAEPFKCNECAQTFLTKGSIKSHIREVHNVKHKGPYRCKEPQCNGMLFKFMKNLLRHKKFQHPDRYLKCLQCDREFAVERQLKRHINTAHLGIRPFICDHCGEGFTSGAQLKRHNLIHTGERPFLCGQCGQSFRQKSVLNTHLKSHKTKGDAFKPTGPMKHIRKRVQPKQNL